MCRGTGITCGVDAAEAQVIKAGRPHLLMRLLPRVAKHLQKNHMQLMWPKNTTATRVAKHLQKNHMQLILAKNTTAADPARPDIVVAMVMQALGLVADRGAKLQCNTAAAHMYCSMREQIISTEVATVEHPVLIRFCALASTSMGALSGLRRMRDPAALTALLECLGGTPENPPTFGQERGPAPTRYSAFASVLMVALSGLRRV